MVDPRGYSCKSILKKLGKAWIKTGNALSKWQEDNSGAMELLGIITIFMGPKGTKIGSISDKVTKDLKVMGLLKKFQSAMAKGLAPRREGTSGIILLGQVTRGKG